MKRRLFRATGALAIAALMIGSFVMSGKVQSDGSLISTLESVNADATTGCEGAGVCTVQGKVYEYAPIN